MTEGDTVDAVQEYATAALKTVSNYIRGLGFRLSANKTQAVILAKRYGAAEPDILLEEKAVRLEAFLNYLGVMLERNVTMFEAYLRAAADKA